MCPITQADVDTAKNYFFGGPQDPRSGFGLDAPKGAIYILANGGVPVLLQKQSPSGGDPNNWTVFSSGGGGGSSVSSTRYWDIQPANDKVLPLSAARAYYPAVLYSDTPKFFDGVALRKYVCYFGGNSAGAAYVAFSDNGIAWDNETLVSGLTGGGYHAAILLVGSDLHYFYWDTVASIYTAGSSRHAVFNPTVSCSAPVSDQACTGSYISGGSGGGNLRAGSYGFNQVFYNDTPTNNPANPYSYQWCAVVSATDGNLEGMLFATSNDGINFSPWNGMTEVIPRGIAPAWDQWLSRSIFFKDSAGLWHAFYSGGLGTSAGEDTNFGGGLGYATSLDGITWVKWDRNPLIRKTESYKSWLRLYTPWVIKDGASYKLYFTCKSSSGQYVVALANFGGFV